MKLSRSNRSRSESHLEPSEPKIRDHDNRQSNTRGVGSYTSTSRNARKLVTATLVLIRQWIRVSSSSSPNNSSQQFRLCLTHLRSGIQFPGTSGRDHGALRVQTRKIPVAVPVEPSSCVFHCWKLDGSTPPGSMRRLPTP